MTKFSSLLDLIVFEDMRCIHEVFPEKIVLYTQGTFEYNPFQKRIGLMNICQLFFILRRYEKGLFVKKCTFRRLADEDSDCAGRRKITFDLFNIQRYLIFENNNV